MDDKSNQKNYELHAVLLPKKHYTLKEAEDYIKKEGYSPLKEVHESLRFYRYRLKPPNVKGKYYTKKLKNKAELVYQEKKTKK